MSSKAEIYIRYIKRKEKNKQRRRNVAVYLSDEEHEKIKRFSESLGISISSLLGMLRQAVEEGDTELVKKLHSLM